MYSTSSQKKYWTFSGDEELKNYREMANRKYVSSIGESISKKGEVCFLTTEEERAIVKNYEYVLKDFMRSFRPKNEALPCDVRSTTFHFYKRFFLMSSVMDYHPKEMMITCIFLACKICEYHVPIDIFVRNIDGNPLLLKTIILDQEMELLYRLNFRINIHSPSRAVEGLMIDLRAHCGLQRPERLNEHISRFLSNMWFTDVCLLYSPPLIALAAVIHAVRYCKENIDDFIIRNLLNCPKETTLQGIIRTVRKIRTIVMNNHQKPPNETVSQLEDLLAKCRNPNNDPNSEIFKRRMLEISLETYLQKNDQN